VAYFKTLSRYFPGEGNYKNPLSGSFGSPSEVRNRCDVNLLAPVTVTGRKNIWT